MKKLLLAASTLALSTFAVGANAWEPAFYAGGNLTSSQYSRDAPEDSAARFTILAVDAMGGADLFKYLAVEARLGIGYNEDSAGWADEKHDLRESYYASFYLRPQVKNERAALYALVGATAAEISSSNPDYEESDAGPSFGVGVSFVVSPTVDVSLEWKQHIKTDDYNIKGGSVGFIYKF